MDLEVVRVVLGVQEVVAFDRWVVADNLGRVEPVDIDLGVALVDNLVDDSHGVDIGLLGERRVDHRVVEEVDRIVD